MAMRQSLFKTLSSFLICIFIKRVKASLRHCSPVGFCTYKVSRGEFWWQLNQDDDCSQEEADEGLQEAPGEQKHVKLPQKKSFALDFLQKMLKNILWTSIIAQEDPPAGVSGAPGENNIMLWNAVIFGPHETPFEVDKHLIFVS